MSSALRDQLRAKIFGAQPSSKLVSIGLVSDSDGLATEQFIEVRQAQVGQMLDNMGSDNMRQRISRMMISCCYIPGSSEQLFEEADFDMLMQLPADHVYTGLMTAITDNMNPKAQEVAAKK
jgi:hypothetical protein